MSEEQRVIELEQLVSKLAHQFMELTATKSQDHRKLQYATTDNGDTSLIILSGAFILLMTIPGLGLYYSGMVRVQNVLASVMQTFSITCLITFMWLGVGYSLAFGPANMSATLGNAATHSSPMIGDGSRLWFWGMNIDSVHQVAPTVPESAFCMFELYFAIITAALICGSFADRMKYGPMLIFMAIWHVGVYCPIAHWNWHPDGFLNKAGVMDWAGGNVVHISSGVAGLMSTIVIGNRKGFGKERFEPHNILLTFFGASLLWVGWYGFVAGSAYTANNLAGIAILNMQISSAMGALTWMTTEWILRKQPSVLGILNGAVAGLVCITPAAGYVGPTGGFFIGFIGGPACYFGAQLKKRLGFDDALDAFGIHAIGGITGGLLTGFFATEQYDHKANGVFYGGGKQLGLQIYGIVVTILWSGLFSYLFLQLVDKTIGLRVTEADEEAGLDSSLHGETIVAYEKENPMSN